MGTPGSGGQQPFRRVFLNQGRYRVVLRDDPQVDLGTIEMGADGWMAMSPAQVYRGNFVSGVKGAWTLYHEYKRRIGETDEAASAKPRLQTVTFSVAIEVDPQEWDLAYGSGTSVKEIREDVRRYFVNTIQQCGAADGAVKNVKERY